MASEWFYQAMGEQLGPVSSAELLALAQRGTVAHDTPVRKGSDGKWVSAKRVRGLFPVSKKTSPQIPVVAATLVEAQPPAVRPPPTKAASSQAAPMIQQPSTHVQEFVKDRDQQQPVVSQSLESARRELEASSREAEASLESITRLTVSHFVDVTENEIAAASLLFKARLLKLHRHSPEIDLWYALRVSKCVPTLKAFKTLASRWSIANRGPKGNSGLQNGRQSSNWGLVNRFLSNLYLQRFRELCEEVASKADETAAKRKTPMAKESAYGKAIEKIRGGAAEFFVEDLPGLHETKTQWIDHLESFVKQWSIAQTETVRAHTESALDQLDEMGTPGAAVEWLTAGDDRVCELCAPLQGIVLTPKEARGLLPRHDECRCCWTPANVGEDTKGQKRSKKAIDEAIDQSIKAEIPETSNRTLAEQKACSSWRGATVTIAENRPKSIFDKKST